MEYIVNKKRLPKVNNDINNIRAIVLAVYDHFKVSSELLNVSQNRYETYIDLLLEAKIILREKNSVGYEIENFLVFDEAKIEAYKKPSFYKFIEKKLLPLIGYAGQIKKNIL